MTAKSVMLTSLVVVLCVALLTYWASHLAPSGGDGDRAESLVDEGHIYAEVPVEGTVHEEALDSATRNSDTDDRQILTPATTTASLGQILRQIVLSRPGDLTEEQTGMLVQSLNEQESSFAAESVDSRWASATEADILGAISRITGLKLITLQVDCRTTMCRLQLAERAGRPDLIEQSGLRARWMLSRIDEHGTRISVVYVGRDEVAAVAAR